MVYVQHFPTQPDLTTNLNAILAVILASLWTANLDSREQGRSVCCTPFPAQSDSDHRCDSGKSNLTMALASLHTGRSSLMLKETSGESD
ncbi:hypothetical protein E2C01_014479 [Portunus trituberculatus]|uniref:Uncharacterized protein n=1 Tax=Portunus trituberculatus TaxID=210409 RepID=A0A5B7DK97_PORTR|nr:hypothetical protein [Portunus trituberculatus]